MKLVRHSLFNIHFFKFNKIWTFLDFSLKIKSFQSLEPAVWILIPTYLQTAIAPKRWEYSLSFSIWSRLIDFALVFPQLLMFEFCKINRISKIEFFYFSSTIIIQAISTKGKFYLQAVQVSIPTCFLTEISHKQ